MKDFYELDELNLPENLTREECASILDISKTTIDRMAEDISSPFFGIRKISRKDFMQFLIENEAANLPVDDADEINPYENQTIPEKEGPERMRKLQFEDVKFIRD